MPHPFRKPSPGGFKRQVVFRVGPDDWTLLEQAAADYGSIQAAILAGLHTLNQPGKQPAKTDPAPAEATEPTGTAGAPPSPVMNRDEEITARHAAVILELEAGTVRGYIRSGRLHGRYDGEPTWRGWLTTRGAVEDYRRDVQGKR